MPASAALTRGPGGGHRGKPAANMPILPPFLGIMLPLCT
jgi:hypothetical protein